MAGSRLPPLRARPALANQRHWELCKPDCAFQRREWIALPLRTRHAGTPRRADACFHTAAQRFVFSTLHFATPIVPTCHADERCMAAPTGNAIDAKQRSNISTNRGWTECRDQREPKQARVDLSSPRRGIVVGTYKQKAAAIRVNRQRSFRR